MTERKVAIGSDVGLHARPAAVFVREALKYPCQIWVESGGRTADGKSILQILALGARRGQEIRIRADGEGENEAVEKLAALIAIGEPKEPGVLF